MNDSASSRAARPLVLVVLDYPDDCPVCNFHRDRRPSQLNAPGNLPVGTEVSIVGTRYTIDSYFWDVRGDGTSSLSMRLAHIGEDHLL